MRRGGLILGALCACAVACAPLDDIDDDTCGNAIVERERGEDCDTFGAEAGTMCRPPGGAGECRFDCSEGVSCPVGWGCGADAICREPSGHFAPGGDTIEAAGAARLRLADFDGDHRKDVLVSTFQSASVAYLDEGGRVGARVDRPTSELFPTAPPTDDLDGDGLADLVLNVGPIGLGVLRGRPERELAPTVQASFQSAAGSAEIRLLTLDALGLTLGDEVFVALDIPGFPVFPGSVENASSSPTPVFRLTESLTNIAGRMLAANLVDTPESGPCDEVVVGMRGDDEVRVFTPCVMVGAMQTYVVDAAPHVVSLPPGMTIASAVLLADLNGDGALDLVADVHDPLPPKCRGVAVAFGVGDGTFHSDPQAIPATDGDDSFVCLEATFVTWSGKPVVEPLSEGPLSDAGLFPLAMGDLDGDGVADVVSPRGVFIADHAQPTRLVQVYDTGAVAWSAAVIADMNDNGLPDVVGGSSDAAGLDFLNGAGEGLFNTFHIPTSGGVSQLTVGDYDGDLLLDLALVVDDPATDEDTMAVLFGEPAGAPAAPIEVGGLPSIQQLVSGRSLLRFLFSLEGSAATPDAQSDLAAISAAPGDGTRNIAILPGSTDRKLASPYLMIDPSGNEFGFGVPMQVLAGELGAGPGRDLAVWALGEPCAPPADRCMHLWNVPVGPDAKLGEAVITYTLDALLPNEKLATPSSATSDLDGDGVDEVVLALPGRGPGAPAGRVLVLRVDPATGLFGAPDEIALDMAVDFRGALEIADVDGDGARDLVLLSIQRDAGTLSVLWNDGGGAFDATRASTLDGATIGGASGFALLQADTDRELEIAIASGTGGRLADPRRDDADIRVRDATVGDLREASLVAAGDLDGDGLEDLATLTGSTVHLFFQSHGGAP
jgi:hypothetical protein